MEVYPLHAQQPSTVIELIHAELARAGVSRTFGLMGEDTAALITYLTRETDVEFVASRHESAAVMMADGHAWATGQLGVCLISRGPGVTNALTAALNAHKAARPVLMISGADPTTVAPIGPDQKVLDHAGISAAAGFTVFSPANAQAVARDLPRAITAAASGRMTVLHIPVDLLSARVEPVADPAPPAVQPAIAGPGAAELAELVTVLECSTRPLILAGAGAHRAQAAPGLVELAERTDALLGTTLCAKGLFAGQRRNVGVVGGFSHRPIKKLLADVDLVVAFGASLNKFTTGHGALFPTARVVHIDHMADDIGRWYPVNLGVVSDVGRAVAAFLERTPPRAADRWSATDALAVLDRHRPVDDFVDESTADMIDPRTLALALNDVLPADRVVVTDGGHFVGFPGSFLDVRGGDRFVFSLDFASIGLGLGMGIGAALARPQHHTAIFVGDGGLLMSLGELETIARYRLPVTVVVMNDHAYGAEKHFLDLEALPDTEAVFPEVDFAPLASALGIDSATVRGAVDLARARELVEARRGPVLLDCKITPWVRAEWLEDFAHVS